MKLSFLIQLMLIIVLVVGLYLLFTNSIQGKMRLILIIFCLVVGTYLFFNLSIFKDHNEVLSSPKSAKDEHTIDGKDLKKTDGPIGISTWIYIDDWNYRYGEEKIILKSADDSEYMPTIKLDSYKNDITVSVNVTDTNYDAALLTQAQTIDSTAIAARCVDGEILYDITGTSDNPSDLDCTTAGPEDITIENINIQKWVNMIVTFNNRTLDVYINGKLVKSKPFDNIIVSGSTSGISITPNGGFGGFVSKTQYFPHFITPAKAWSIYRGGFGDMLESALNKYKLSVSFYEDDVERNKVFIF